MQFKQKFLLQSLIFAVAILSGGCNDGASTATNAGSNSDKSTIQALTIDVSASIPQFSGAPSNGVAIIHNNSDAAIKNIQYQLDTNLSGEVPVLLSNSCSEIAAYSSCSLSVGLSKSLTNTNPSGAVKLIASYKNETGDLVEFDSVLNFKFIDDIPSGVYVSPVNLTGFGAKLSRGVAYVYIPGDSASNYLIKSMKIATPGFKIVGGDITGSHIHSGSVIPVEIEGATPQNLALADFDIEYTVADNAKLLSSHTQLGVFGEAAGGAALLSASLVPVIDAENHASGTAYFQNVGAAAVTIDSIKASDGISAKECSGKIEVGQTCSVKFTVPSNVDKVSNGSIAAKSGDTEISADVSWYNGTPAGGAIVSLLNVDNDLLILKQGVSSDLEAIVSNPGGFKVDGSLLRPIPYAGNLDSTAPSLADPNCELSGHTACNYKLSVTDSVAEAVPNLVEFNYRGSYKVVGGEDEVVSGKKLISYQLVNKAPNLTVELPYQPFQLTVQGDGKHTQKAKVIINNVGDVAAKFSNIELQKTADSTSEALSFISVDANNCTNSALLAGKSCSVYIALGAISTDDLKEGKVKLSVAYYGTKEPATQDISYQVLPATFGVSATFNNMSGVDKIGESYIIKGSTSSEKSISWTLSNNGVDQTLQAVEFSSFSPDVWSIDNTANDSCFKGEDIGQPQKLSSFLLGKDKSCTIKFINVYGKAAPITEKGSKLTNLYFPKLRVKYKDADYIWLYPPVTDNAALVNPGVSILNQQGFLNISSKIINDGVYNSNHLELNYQLDEADGYSQTQFITILPRNIVQDDGAEAFGPCDIEPAGTSGEASAKLKVICDLNGSNSGFIESIPLDSKVLIRADYNIPLLYSTNLGQNATIGITQTASNVLAKQVHGYIYLTDQEVSDTDLQTFGWDGACKAKFTKSEDYQDKGYTHFEAFNLNDNSGFFDDLPESFPLNNIVSDELVTWIDKGKSKIVDSKDANEYRNLVHYPFFNPIDKNEPSGKFKVWLHASGGKWTNLANVQIQKETSDCSSASPALSPGLWYWNSGNLANSSNDVNQRLRNLQSKTDTKTSSWLDTNDTAYSCNKFSAKLLCVAY